MKNKLNIELFKFNHKTDYLPYYKHYVLEYNDTQSINDILGEISSRESLGYEKNCNLKINQQFINSSTLIIDVVSKLGKNLKIESICEYRALNDLKILNTDYHAKIEVFIPFLSEEEIISYVDSLELIYYASNTINYNKDYIGDHSLVIAYDIIKNKPQFRDDLLDIISGIDGVYHYTSSKNRLFDYDESIEKKYKVLFDLALENSKPALAKNNFFAGLCKDGAILDKNGNTNEQKVTTIKQYFNDFNIAYYDGLKASELKSNILDSKAKLIEIDMRNEDLPAVGLEQSKNVLYKICGDILLQAKDNDADFLVIKDERLLELFDKEQKKISELIGRDIDLVVVSQNQFAQMLDGQKDKEILGFNNHKIKVEFLESA